MTDHVPNDIPVDEARQFKKENPHDTNLYAPQVLFYPGEGRVDINLLRKRDVENMNNGWYHPGQEGPLYMFLSRTPLPSEVSTMLQEKGMAGTPVGETIEKVFAEVPAQVSYDLRVRSYDSEIAKSGWSYLSLKFDKTNGATIKTDLNETEVDFVLEEMNEAINIVLNDAKSGKEKADIPPGIGHDPLHILMTDEQFEEKVPKLYGSKEYIAKIRKQRTQTLAEMKWLQLTIQEIKSKKESK